MYLASYLVTTVIISVMDFVKLPIWFGTYMDYLWLCHCLLLTMSSA